MIENTGNIITGYVKNNDRHRQDVTSVAKSTPLPGFGRLNVIMSWVLAPNDWIEYQKRGE